MIDDALECHCSRSVGVRFRPVGDVTPCRCGYASYDETHCQYCAAAPVSHGDALCEECSRLSDTEQMVCSQNIDRLRPGSCDDVSKGHPSAIWWDEGDDAFCSSCVMYTDW
jgi:hypothetical protein